MDLKRRLVKLESLAAVRHAHMEPTFSPEDLACMQRIIDRVYADPQRNAGRIAIFEQAKARLAAAGGENPAQG